MGSGRLAGSKGFGRSGCGEGIVCPGVRVLECERQLCQGAGGGKEKVQPWSWGKCLGFPSPGAVLRMYTHFPRT